MLGAGAILIDCIYFPLRYVAFFFFLVLDEVTSYRFSLYRVYLVVYYSEWFM